MSNEAAHGEEQLGLADGIRPKLLSMPATLPAETGVAGPIYNHPNLVVSRLVRFSDAVSFGLTTLLAVLLVIRSLAQAGAEAVEVSGAVGILVFLLYPKARILLHFPRLTDAGRQVRYILPPLLMALLAEFLVLWGLGWRFGQDMAAALPLCAAPIAATLLTRGLGTIVLTRPSIQKRLARRVAIVGSGHQVFRIANQFEQQGARSFNLVGVFDDGARLPNETPVHGSIADLIALSREHRLHGIIIALPPSDEHEKKVSRLVWRMRSVLADVYIMPYLVHGPDLMLPTETVGPLTLMVLQRRPLSESQMVVKSALDVLLAAAALVFLSPLLVAVALAIKLESPGPILFRQPRQGFNNRPFTVFKFRSMYTDQTDLTAAQQTSRGDPRVTRVGKWIRRLSIDELPQVLNVLRGDMSLVGPRPHAPHTRAGGKLLDDALAEYVIRHQVKPGITGWAQVNGARGELVTTDDLHRRVAFDLDYMRRWSLWFDIKIIWLTVLREIVSRNAF